MTDRKMGKAHSSGETDSEGLDFSSMTNELLVPYLATLEPCLSKPQCELSQEIQSLPTYPNRGEGK